MFVQGYDITDEAHLAEVLDEADAKVGIDRLGAVHVNDAAAPLGSCRDRHANIGKGEMGKRGLAAFLSEPRFEGLPATLETPGPDKKGSDRKEVTLAKRLRREGLKAPRARSELEPRLRTGPRPIYRRRSHPCRLSTAPAGGSGGTRQASPQFAQASPTRSPQPPKAQATRTGPQAGPCSPAVNSLFDVDAGDRAGNDQALDL